MAKYNFILDTMKNAYFDVCGENPDMYGDDGICLKAVASELYNLALEAEYAVKQSSYKTATGENLERIASECGLHRKQGSYATGVLIFSIDEAAGEDITIGEGTICAKNGKKFIQYKTTRQCVIKAGELTAEAPCVALKKGFEYNAEPGEITVMVNPPQKVQRVTNISRITDGYDSESDTALRSRIIDAIKCPYNAINDDYLRVLICDIDDVLDYKLVNGEYVVSAYVKTYSGALGEETRNKIYNILSFAELMGAYLAVEASTPLSVDISVMYYGDADEQKIKDSVCSYMDTLSLGTRPDEQDLSDYIRREVGGAEYVNVTFGDCEYISYDNYYVIGDLEVGAYEG